MAPVKLSFEPHPSPLGPNNPRIATSEAEQTVLQMAPTSPSSPDSPTSSTASTSPLPPLLRLNPDILGNIFFHLLPGPSRLQINETSMKQKTYTTKYRRLMKGLLNVKVTCWELYRQTCEYQSQLEIVISIDDDIDRESSSLKSDDDGDEDEESISRYDMELLQPEYWYFRVFLAWLSPSPSRRVRNVGIVFDHKNHVGSFSLLFMMAMSRIQIETLSLHSAGGFDYDGHLDALYTLCRQNRAVHCTSCHTLFQVLLKFRHLKRLRVTGAEPGGWSNKLAASLMGRAEVEVDPDGEIPWDDESGLLEDKEK